MAIRDLLWGCPYCRTANAIRPDGRRERCAACGAAFRRGAGATIIGRPGGRGVPGTNPGAGLRASSEAAETLSPADWLGRLGEPVIPAPDAAGLVLGGEQVMVRTAESQTPIELAGETLGWRELYGPRTPARLELSAERIRCVAADGRRLIDWSLDEVTSLLPASSSLQITAAPNTASLRFTTGSVRFWTAALSTLIRRHFHARGYDVVEFQPHVVTSPLNATPNRVNDRAAATATTAAAPGNRTTRQPLKRRQRPLPPPPGTFYWTIHALPRLLWPLYASLHVDGLEHLPTAGPFLLLSNHQSVLDPLLIQSVSPRPIHTMTKSTQFASRFAAEIMRRCYAFPVRRFQTDPQSVRMALRRLSQGYAVHIYVEGERTWDGGLQPPRPGTLRIALKAGVPILPCAIDGSYDAWPRWDRRPRRTSVRIAFGPSFTLPQLDRRADREAALPAAADTIMSAIRQLLGQHARTTAAREI